MSLPTGTITFLFTDIEGSTRLLQDLGNGAYGQALADHHRLLRAAFQENGGEERESHGDGLFFTFPSAKAAVRAAVTAQRALLGHSWPEGASVRVRMGLHTGEPNSGETGYVGVDIHRAARICAAAHGGQVVFSQTTHDLVADDLPDGMSLRDMGQHRLKDLTHPQHLFQAVVADLPDDFPPLKSLDALPNNLPIQLTSFVGRDQEKAEVKQLLSRARLVTLTGSGGAGKTRLALQVAADVLEQFKDGVWVAELAPLSDPGLVPKAIASAMNVPEQPGRPLSETLVDSLRAKALLLVLDNCEHLLSACMPMADMLLRACPKVQILATSRAALGLPGEALWRVPSLSLPDPQSRPSLEQLARSEAVRLFVERAVLSHQGFAVTSRNAVAVVQVCHRLDGIPLAIELAAARVKVLTVEQIAARLDDRFRLLTGGSQAVLPRQQTLRATMDWSYGLLSDQERVLLRRLSVFAGGWTLEAAEAICVGDDVEGLEVLDLLTQLVEKSLVMAEEHGQEVRYRLLETVRQYARDKLLVAVETIEVQRRHRDWYLGLAERMAQKRWGPDQAVGLDRLESEHDNLRAALAWSLEEGGAEVGLRLAGALGWFWHTRGYWSEGRDRLNAVLLLSGSSAPSARAKALFWAARLALRQNDRGLARSLYDESLSLFRELGSKRDMAILLDDLGIAAQDEGDFEAARSLHEESLATFRDSNERNGLGFALLHLGELAGFQGDVETARSHLGESLVIFRELGDRNGIASSLRDLGWLARHQGDYEAARSHFEESLTIFRGLGNKQMVGWMLGRLGSLAGYQRDYVAARRLYEESLAIFRELGSSVGVAWTLCALGRVTHWQGDYAAAGLLHEESLAIFRDLGEKPGIGWALKCLGDTERLQGDHGRAALLYAEALTLLSQIRRKIDVGECVEGFAALAGAAGQPVRAARLFGAAEALRNAIGYRLPPADRLEHDRDVSALQTYLGGKAFAEAWSEGRAMTLQQAIEYALREEDGTERRL